MSASPTIIETNRLDYETYLKRFRRILSYATTSGFHSITPIDIDLMDWHSELPVRGVDAALIPEFEGVMLVSYKLTDSTAVSDYFIQIQEVLFKSRDARSSKLGISVFEDLHRVLMHRESLADVEAYSSEEMGNELVEFLEDYRDWGFVDNNWNKA